jgi:hypothetical protein
LAKACLFFCASVRNSDLDTLARSKNKTTPPPPFVPSSFLTSLTYPSFPYLPLPRLTCAGSKRLPQHPSNSAPRLHPHLPISVYPESSLAPEHADLPTQGHFSRIKKAEAESRLQQAQSTGSAASSSLGQSSAAEDDYCGEVSAASKTFSISLYTFHHKAFPIRARIRHLNRDSCRPRICKPYLHTLPQPLAD